MVTAAWREPPCPSSATRPTRGRSGRCRNAAWPSCWPAPSPRTRRCCCATAGCPHAVPARLACSVCPHRPVCDTLETLVLHRAGRKHLDSLQRSYGRHRSPQVTPQGPQEASGVAPALQAPLLARTRRIARSALLKSAPYSSCCRRAGTKGSSSRAGTSGMIPNNSQTAPEAPRNPGNPEGSGPTHREGVPKAGRKGNSRFSEGLSPERLRILRHHLHLRSRGWLQDPAGNWVKDGNAEFDSDEEEPPPLPPA
ncbi:sodium channel modifier 1 isoform 1-T1 [Cyanocitta cristata]